LNTSHDDFSTKDDVYDALGEVLVELATDGQTEDDINKLCNQFFIMLKGTSDNKQQESNRTLKLDTPVTLGKLSEANSNDKVGKSVFLVKKEDISVGI
jgi:hypothetical protein